MRRIIAALVIVCLLGLNSCEVIQFLHFATRSGNTLNLHFYEGYPRLQRAVLIELPHNTLLDTSNSVTRAELDTALRQGGRIVDTETVSNQCQLRVDKISNHRYLLLLTGSILRDGHFLSYDLTKTVRFGIPFFQPTSGEYLLLWLLILMLGIQLIRFMKRRAGRTTSQ